MRTFNRFFFCVLFTAFSALSLAQVERSVLTSSIENREPIDDLGNRVVPDGSDVQTVFFFTHLMDMQDTQVVHRWIYQGEEKATVTLNIGSNNWRTYSSKKLLPHWQGTWQVQVWRDDLMLTDHEFEFGPE